MRHTVFAVAAVFFSALQKVAQVLYAKSPFKPELQTDPAEAVDGVALHTMYLRGGGAIEKQSVCIVFRVPRVGRRSLAGGRAEAPTLQTHMRTSVEELCLDFLPVGVWRRGGGGAASPYYRASLAPH